MFDAQARTSRHVPGVARLGEAIVGDRRGARLQVWVHHRYSLWSAEPWRTLTYHSALGVGRAVGGGDGAVGEARDVLVASRMPAVPRDPKAGHGRALCLLR